jgi:tetratricopeptide (TPR) repeat protein
MRQQFFRIISCAILLLMCLAIIPASAYSADATRLFDQGNTLITTKNYSQAIAAFDQAIALEPSYYEAWDRKADVMNRAGNFSDALAASTQSLTINPGYGKGWINRGQILYNIGYYYEDVTHDQARADQYYQDQLLAYEKAVQIDPSNAEAWFNKGYALAGMKRYDEAIAAFDKVESLDPKYPNLPLSQKQARVLRDAATPSYEKYFPLIIGVILLIVIITGVYLYKRRDMENDEEAPAANRQERRKKER